jgi:hypothetical protein
MKGELFDESGNPVIENGEVKIDRVEYVHGGIAFYGGGRNYSMMLNTEEELSDLELKELKDISLTGILSTFSGTEPFRFYMYDKDSSINPFSSPNIHDLREYYYENKALF